MLVKKKLIQIFQIRYKFKKHLKYIEKSFVMKIDTLTISFYFLNFSSPIHFFHLPPRLYFICNMQQSDARVWEEKKLCIFFFISQFTFRSSENICTLIFYSLTFNCNSIIWFVQKLSSSDSTSKFLLTKSSFLIF